MLEGVISGFMEEEASIACSWEDASWRKLVSRPFPSWNRSILTEIYLCHACCQAILRTETAGQGAQGPGGGGGDGGGVNHSYTACSVDSPVACGLVARLRALGVS